MKKFFWIVVAGLLLYPFVSTTGFVVDERQYAIVSSGEVKQVISEPGFYFKMPIPFQRVALLDRKVQTTESDLGSIVTSDKHSLKAEAYVKWRIANPKQFFVAFSGDQQRVQDRMAEIAKVALGDEIAKLDMNELVSGDRTKLLDAVQKRMVEDTKSVGIEIIDARLMRVNFAETSTAVVLEGMNADMAKVASEVRATGTADAEKIRAEADRQKAITVADAYRDAQKIRGEGDAKAAHIYAQAYGQNPEFAKFWRSLEAYRESFKNRTDVVVVDPSSEFFKYMRNPKPSGAK